MENGIIRDIAGLIDELKSLKNAYSFKFHACRDSDSFDCAIDCAIEAVESYVEAPNV